MRTKECNICKVEKDIKEFFANGYTPKGTKKYKPACKPCSMKKVYADKIKNIKLILAGQRRSYACERCGYNKNHAALTFHHFTEEKNFEIGSRCTISFERLEYEISICDLLCQNCHSEEHNPHLMNIDI